MKKPVNPHLIENQKRFDYYAFISYKHLDKHWAKWVQKQLEYYRLPNQICHISDVPKRLTPVFRDETDLAGGKNVKAHLLDKIGRSKYLIVICSRHMQVSPKYIDYEVESFLAAGNPASRILPLIVDGEANSRDPEKECLPPSIKAMGEDMPLGIAMNHKKRKETVLKLIASILELELHTLRSHDQERKNRRIIASLCGGLAASLALGAFITWEALQVKQAGLREQLTYAMSTFEQGNRLSSAAGVAAVKEAYVPLMDKAILSDVQELELLSSLHPKYQPMVSLAPRTTDSRLLFTADGDYVMVITDHSVQKFDMQGTQVMNYDVSQHAHQIVDVCADGVHAAVVSYYLPGLEGSRLWLWNMVTDTAVCELAASTAYDQNDARMGYLGGVVDGCFSQDGSMICAYRDGAGYYNSNDELAAWDTATGEKLFSLPGELLGKMNQPYEVEAFEYIGSDTFHWTGSSNHVFYTLGASEPVVIPKTKLPRIVKEQSQKLMSLEHERYTITFSTDTASVILTDLADGKMLEIPQMPDCSWFECGSNLVLIAQAEGCIRSVQTAELGTMTMNGAAASFSALCSGRQFTGAAYSPDGSCLYILLDGTELYRFDPADGGWMLITATDGGRYVPLACTGSMDVLVAPSAGKTSILEVQDGQVRRYTMGEATNVLLETSVFSGASPYMAMAHNGMYYLYPLEHPGTRLEAGLPTGSAVHSAAGSDGRLVVQGFGMQLLIWDQDVLAAQLSLPGEVCNVWAGEEYVLALTEQELFLYDAAGSLIASCKPKMGELFCSAKATTDGSRIAVLSKDDVMFENRPCRLRLLDGKTLKEIAVVSDRVHVAPSSAYEVAYDLSANGKWVAAVERVSEEGESRYQLSTSVFSGWDGNLAAQSQSINNRDVPVFDLISVANGIASAYRQQYVAFGAGDTLLSGLQYGTWIFDLAEMETRCFLSESSNCDALPLLLANGRLLYPTNGLHVWNIVSGQLEAGFAHAVAQTDINAMLKAENQNRLYLTEDERWIAFTGAEDTWLYCTDDWSRQTILAAQPSRILYLDDALLIYATPDGLWRLEIQ